MAARKEGWNEKMSEAKIIDGKAFARGMRERVAAAVVDFKAKNSITPNLTVVLVGEDPASQIYVRNKGKQTEEAGMESITHRLPAKTSEEDLLALIAQLNADKTCNGILVQLPLPKHIDEQRMLGSIDPDKDVDGFHLMNVGRLWTGARSMAPCTPYGCLLVLKDTIGDLKGLRALVLGRSNIVGKPMAALLLATPSSRMIFVVGPLSASPRTMGDTAITGETHVLSASRMPGRARIGSTLR